MFSFCYYAILIIYSFILLHVVFTFLGDVWTFMHKNKQKYKEARKRIHKGVGNIYNLMCAYVEFLTFEKEIKYFELITIEWN